MKLETVVKKRTSCCTLLHTHRMMDTEGMEEMGDKCSAMQAWQWCQQWHRQLRDIKKKAQIGMKKKVF